MFKTIRTAAVAIVAGGAAFALTPGGTPDAPRLTRSAVALTQELTPCQQSCQQQYEASIAACWTSIPDGTSYSTLLRQMCFQNAQTQLNSCYQNCGG